MTDNHQIVQFLVSTSDVELSMSDTETVCDLMASGELFLFNIWQLSDSSDKAETASAGYLKQLISVPSIRKYEAILYGTLSDLQGLEDLNDAEDVHIFEVYQDGSIGGIPVRSGSVGIEITAIKGFKASLCYLDDIKAGSDEIVYNRDAFINYAYPSEYNNHNIRNPSYDTTQINTLKSVYVNGRQDGGVEVILNTGFQCDEYCLVSGLEDYFKYSDETLATGITELYAGAYFGFDNTKDGITLVLPTEQDGCTRYKAENTLGELTIYGENNIVAVDGNNLSLLTEY